MSKNKKPEMLKTIDWWAIWVSFFIIFSGLLVFMPPSEITPNKKYERYSSQINKNKLHKNQFLVNDYLILDSLNSLEGVPNKFGQNLSNIVRQPYIWTNNPVEAFYQSKETAELKAEKANKAIPYLNSIAEEKLFKAKHEEALAEKVDYSDNKLNISAKMAVSEWRKAVNELRIESVNASSVPYKQLPNIILFFIFIAILFGTAEQFMDRKFGKFAAGFAFVFLISLLSFTMASNYYLRELGFGYPFWALLFGMIFNKLTGAPKWLSQGAKMELFIKTGIVLLGAEVALSGLAENLSGAFWLFPLAAIAIVFIVYFISLKTIKITSREFSITIALSTALGGLTGLLAAAPASKSKKYEFTVIACVVVIFSIAINFVIIPALNSIGLPTALTGSIWHWFVGAGMGFASGEYWDLFGNQILILDKAVELHLFMILISALAVAVVWRFKKEPQEISDLNMLPADLWKKFPKYILGAVVASVVVSLIYAFNPKDVTHIYLSKTLIADFIKPVKNWIFCFAFAAAGMTFNFTKAIESINKLKPAAAYAVGIVLSLLVVAFLFVII